MLLAKLILLRCREPYLLLVVFQMGGGVQAAAQTLVPRRVACWAVMSSGAVAIGIGAVRGFGAVVLGVGRATPIMVRSS